MHDSILVLGVGNSLLTDEGAGVHVVEYLRRYHGRLADVVYLDGGTLSFTLAEPIANTAGLIAVDAARMDSPPGTVKVFAEAAMEQHLSTARSSVHEVGLLDLMEIARLSGTLPRHRCLVGIEPESLGWGEQPSPRVAAAIPIAAGQILEIISAWRGWL